ncbi:hypothetical protein Dtox_0875 [Desulfofarcimen acetoxidans DSM 771]|uniref:Uncharacterized protein n=1 Tax=Desulfofarcimen acetoxidans (strain ATCC 49208 / DSM 771 / KCTC 5769 / VKM B-1644 / 5575) TaxID=485916 RepID=C8W2A8_DESAS|nr:hypothetical protein [Desulfofarcimen acetoxidans]ACV61772.1 hypothetical protein Dtox_0875 [Desulfofarcimen acetoxidans DSM 771]
MRGKKSDDVYLTIYGYKTFGEEHFAEEFFQMLNDANPAYLPHKIGMYEPIKTPFSMEEAKKMWVESEKVGKFYGGIMLKGRKTRGDISWKNDNSNIVGLVMSRELVIKNNGTKNFIELAKKLFLWSNGVYGYTCHISNLIYTPGLSHETCLGHITWMTLYGPPYVEMFGKEVIQTAPCKVEEFAKDHFILLTSDEPMEINPEMLEIQERVKKHLGEDAFCRKEPFRTEPLTMEDLIAGRDSPSTEGYRSPDLSSYTTDSGKKDEDEGLVVKINDDGTMTTYTVKPEKKK